MFETITGTDLVAAARDRRAVADRAEVDLLDIACQWADAHPPLDDEAATYVVAGGDTGLVIAGEGCPEASEIAVSEFATAVGLGTECGKRLIGQALELRHRLPRI